MIEFNNLTHRGQILRLRKLAVNALKKYDLNVRRIQTIDHCENTTFKVQVCNKSHISGYSPDVFLLRVHRAGYQNERSIRSELKWLQALRRDTTLIVPETVPDRDRDILVKSTAPGIDQKRFCSLLRWIPGQFRESNPLLVHFKRVGHALALLHDHACNWKENESLTRPRWDWDGLLWHGHGYGDFREIWPLFSDEHYKLFWTVAEKLREAFRQLGTSSDAFGVIHGDPHLGNIVFQNKQACPIDFDDCGHGPWIYDFAVILDEYVHEPEFDRILDALLAGYRAVKSVDPDQLSYLPEVMAARRLTLMLWCRERALHNEWFRNNLHGWLDWTAKGCRTYLEQRN